jgi:hypothetical protein
MALTIFQNIWAWATAEASNANVDSGINWTEGQDPATVNNSARNMMAATKRWANVNSGNVGVAGTADAIQITTGQTIETGQQALGFRICFKAGATNTGAATVAVDGLSAVAIKRPNGDALSAGDIVSGAFHDIAFDGTNYRLFVPGAGGSYGSLSGSNTWTGSNIFQAGATIGDDAADVVVIKGTTVNATVSAWFSSTSAAAFRTNIGLSANLGLDNLNAGAGAPATTDYVIYRDNATPVYRASTLPALLTAALNSLPDGGAISITGGGAGSVFLVCTSGGTWQRRTNSLP